MLRGDEIGVAGIVIKGKLIENSSLWALAVDEGER